MLKTKKVTILTLLAFTFVFLLSSMSVFAYSEPVTWNPNDKNTGVNLSNNNLTVHVSGIESGIRANHGKSSGKWYWENSIDELGHPIVGIANLSAELKSINRGAFGNTAVMYGHSRIFPDGPTVDSLEVNSTVGIALDMDNKTVTFYVNGVMKGGPVNISQMGAPIYPYVLNVSSAGASTITTNFGATPFKYAIPSGYEPYETKTESPILAVLLDVDETVQLSVTRKLLDNAALTWTSADGSVASVDANGKVTAIAEGFTYISAQNADGSFNDSIPVRVFENAEEMRLAVHLLAGQKAELYLAEDPAQVAWTSLDNSVVTVSSTGELTAVGKGLAIVQGEIEGETYQIYIRVNS